MPELATTGDTSRGVRLASRASKYWDPAILVGKTEK